MPVQPNIALQTILNLAQGHPLETHPPGAFIFRANDPGAFVYAIVDGTVEISWGQGLQEILQPGCCFGFDVMVDTAKRRYCTAKALSAVQLLPLDRERFMLAIQEFPMFALESLQIMDERLRGIRVQNQATDFDA
jgi:CRP/FNR family cyclic AMP-dependent transcriptional regulator